MMIDSIVTFVAEIISEVASGYIADEYGRLIVLKGSGFLGGIGFILYVLIDNPSIKSLLVFITSFGFSALFNVIFIYSPEIFPTSIRSTVMGYLYLLSRLGALIVPSVSSIIPNPPILFGVLSIISSFLCFYLSETLGQEIEDDMPEIVRKKSFLSSNRLKSNIISSRRNFSKKSLNRAILSDHFFKIEE